MHPARRIIILICAGVLATLGVIGIVRFQSSAAGIAFHALVLVAAAYLAVLAVRRA
jgi:hypothetical protein